MLTSMQSSFRPHFMTMNRTFVPLRSQSFSRVAFFCLDRSYSSNTKRINSIKLLTVPEEYKSTPILNNGYNATLNEVLTEAYPAKRTDIAKLECLLEENKSAVFTLEKQFLKIIEKLAHLEKDLKEANNEIDQLHSKLRYASKGKQFVDRSDSKVVLFEESKNAYGIGPG